MIDQKSAGFRIAFVTAAAGVLAACSPGGGAGPAPAAADTSADATAVRAVEAQWNQDLKAGVVEPVVSHYSHDARLMAPGEPMAEGPDAIREAMTTAMADPRFTLTFTPDRVVVASSGDFAYTTGKYSQTATNPKTHAVDKETGTYVTVYHKVADGSWRAVADINTPGPPAP